MTMKQGLDRALVLNLPPGGGHLVVIYREYLLYKK